MKPLKHKNIKTILTPISSHVFMFLCFYVFMNLLVVGNVTAQTIPSELEAALPQIQAIELDKLSAPSVDVIISASGVVGTTATLSTNTENINDNTSLFSWYLDDITAPILSGKAKTSFSFRTTKKFHTIRVVLSENKKIITQNTVSISSFSVSLVWSTDTFIPSDYEGKAMPIVGSRVTVIASPNIINEQANDLLYTWYIYSESRVRNILGEQEFSFIITKNISFIPIVVEVSNQQGSIRVRESITIPILKPTVILRSTAQSIRTAMPYHVTTITAGERMIIQAQPFYFHIKSLNDISYQWSFLGKNVFGIPPDPNILRLTIPKDSATGRKFLNIKVVNHDNLGEKASTEMEIIIL